MIIYISEAKNIGRLLRHVRRDMFETARPEATQFIIYIGGKESSDDVIY